MISRDNIVVTSGIRTSCRISHHCASNLNTLGSGKLFLVNRKLRCRYVSCDRQRGWSYAPQGST